MTKRKTNKLTLLLIITGALLILSALSVTLITSSLEKNAAKHAEKIAESVMKLMPEIENSAPDGRADVRMPSVSIDGTDFCAVIEIPKYGVCLPVCSDWDRTRLRMYPCRYTGSMYDGTLIVGGSDAKGQLDFTKIITEGDFVFVTDTEGQRYSYEVSGIEITEDAKTETLSSDTAELVLFARNTYGGGYTVIKCKKGM